MVRYVTLLLLFLGFTHAVGQNHIAGRIVDHENGTPVKYAQVRFQGTYCGTATNRNGEFILNLGACDGDELVITSALHESKVIPLREMSTPIEISLQKKAVRSTFRTDQALICDVVQSMLTKIPRNYYGKNYLATSFHREYVKSFNNIVQVMEGAVTSRNTTGRDEVANHEFLFAEDKNHRDLFWHPSKGGFYTFGWQPVTNEGKPSSNLFLGIHLKSPKDLAKYYDFRSSGTLRDSNGSIYIIKFDQKENVKAALFRGTIYIDSASHALTRIEYEMSPKGFSYVRPNVAGGHRLCKPPLKLEVVRESGEVNYQKIGSRWYLANQSMSAQFNASVDSIKSNRDAHFMKIYTEKIITAFDTSSISNNATAASEKASLTHNYIKSNFENYKSERTEWPGHMMLKPDTSIFEAVRVLRINNQLWERKEGRKALIALKASTMFTPDQLKKDLVYLKEMFFRLHPAFADPSQKTQLLRAIGNAERRIQRTTSENEFHKLLAPVIESIHCGHTQVISSQTTEDYNRRFGKYFPFELTVIGRRAFLSQGVADSAAGLEVVEINGTAMVDVLQNIRYKASTEGTSVSDKDYYLGRNFAALYGINYLQTDSFKVSLRNHSTRKIHKLTFPASGYRIKENMNYNPVKAIDSIQTTLINLPGNLNEISLKKFLERTFPLIDQARYTNMIIDLRNNESFRDSDAATLFSYVTSTPFTFYKRMELTCGDTVFLQKLTLDDKNLLRAVPQFASSIVRTDSSILFSGHPAIGEATPQPGAFRGNLFVIVNGGSSSAAIDFAKFIQLQKRGVVIGQESVASFHGTCDAGKVSFALPHSKLRVLIPLATYIPGVETAGNTRLIPDHLVECTADDLIGKRDPEMETCRNLIVANCCSAKSN